MKYQLRGVVTVKKIKMNKYWLIFFVIIGLLFSIGVTFFLFLPSERYTFLYENLIWFPIEITIVIIVINNLINSMDKRKEKIRFSRVTKRPTETMIASLKNNVVDIIHTRNIYDENRPDTNELYEKILKSLDTVVSDQLILSTKSYSFGNSSIMNLNLIGILYTECSELDNNLKKYIDRFHVFFDDDIYLAITSLEKNNYNLGVLNYPLSMNGGYADTHQMSGDLEYTKVKIKEHILQINELIKILNDKLN